MEELREDGPGAQMASLGVWWDMWESALLAAWQQQCWDKKLDFGTQVKALRHISGRRRKLFLFSFLAGFNNYRNYLHLIVEKSEKQAAKGKT